MLCRSALYFPKGATVACHCVKPPVGGLEPMCSWLLLAFTGGFAAVGDRILLELCIKETVYCATPYFSLVAFLISLLFNLQRKDVR